MSDVGAVQQNDAGGVGLFRTEFVYLNCTDYPTEEYQFEAYKQVLESLAPKRWSCAPVISARTRPWTT